VQVTVDFQGTFAGVAGAIRGSPFTINAVEPSEVKNINGIEGPVMIQCVTVTCLFE
jgi:hypothetical protein